jgi:hypothetical protein
MLFIVRWEAGLRLVLEGVYRQPRLVGHFNCEETLIEFKVRCVLYIWTDNICID